MVLLAYLKRQWKLLLLLLGIVGVFAAVFSLYDLPLEAVGYAAVLCLVLGGVLFVLGFWRFRSRHHQLRRLLDQAEGPVLPLPPAGDLLESDYQALLRAVAAHRTRLLAKERDKLEAANIALNLGTMTSIRKITMPTAINRTMEGYTMAAVSYTHLTGWPVLRWSFMPFP